MEKRYPVFPILFLFLFIFSCSKNKEIKEFPVGEELSGELVEDITVFSQGNVYINVVDTFLVVTASRDTPFLRIYSTNNHKLLKEFGEEGRGPREFLSVTPLRQTGYDTSNESPVLFVHDFQRNKIAGINLKKLIREEETFSLKNLPQSSSYLTFVHYWDDKHLVATPSGGGNLFIQDFESNQSVLVPYLPKLNYTLAQPELRQSMIYRMAVVANKERGLIAAAPQFLGELDFFDFEGNLVRSSIFEARDAYEYELTSSGPLNDIKYQIIDLDTKEGLIYGLNYNVSAQNYNSEKWGSKVQVFNWDGDPLIEYPLDGRPVRSFAVDEIHKRIYAYDPSENEHNIVVYSIE